MHFLSVDADLAIIKSDLHFAVTNIVCQKNCQNNGSHTIAYLRAIPRPDLISKSVRNEVTFTLVTLLSLPSCKSLKSSRASLLSSYIKCIQVMISYVHGVAHGALNLHRHRRDACCDRDDCRTCGGLAHGGRLANSMQCDPLDWPPSRSESGATGQVSGRLSTSGSAGIE